MDERKPTVTEPQPLKEEQIVTVREGRRSFLGTVALGSAALAAAALTQACGTHDRCDSDVSHFRDHDPFDLVTVPGDRCDSDAH